MQKYIIAGLALLSIIGGIIYVVNDGDMRSAMSSMNSDGGQESQLSQDYGEAVTRYISDSDFRGSMDMRGQDSVELSIGDFYFEPTEVIVSPGTTVTWVNDGNVRHNVVSWSQSPKMGLNTELLAKGETYEFTFEESGVYVYFCEPHPFTMRGVVSVQE